MVDEVTQRGEHTQQAIVQAALQLFQQNGFHGTSMRQIAQRAGIAVGGIYNHFASKEDIFVAVLKANHPYHEMLPALKQANGETIEAYVSAAASAMVAALEKRPDFLNLMLIEIVEFKTKHIPPLFEALFPQFISVVEVFAQRQNNLRPIPLPMIIRGFFGLFFSYYVTEKLLHDQFPPEMTEGALDYFVDIFLHGIVSGD